MIRPGLRARRECAEHPRAGGARSRSAPSRSRRVQTLAERERFEPSVRFCYAKPRLVRKLHAERAAHKRRARTHEQAISYPSPSSQTWKIIDKTKYFVAAGPVS